MIIECITVVLCVLIICISICYCNKPSISLKKIMNIENLLLDIHHSLSEIDINTASIDKELEQLNMYK